MFKKQKIYCSVSNPTIEAVVNHLFRLPDRETALRKISHIKKSFVTSRQKTALKTEDPHIVLWIKGFEVTEEESRLGYLGNFAVITIKEIEPQLFSLNAIKITEPLRIHPQRKYVARNKHPNWGHPLLRKIKNNTTFFKQEEAEAILTALHQEYPDSTIPGISKLYVIIFSRDTTEQKPVKKFIFEIKVTPENKFTISYRENISRRKPLIDSKEPIDNSKAGYFTSMIALKRKGKKPKKS